MKFLAVILAILLAIVGLGTLLATPDTKKPGQTSDVVSDKQMKPIQANQTVSLAADHGEQLETQGEFVPALEWYTGVMKARPRWPALYFRAATCQAALEKTEEAVKTLRALLGMKTATAELQAQARAALQELLVPKIGDHLLDERKHALALIQAGEELKKHENEDLEIRLEHKLSAQPYHKAIELLEKITTEFSDHCPTHLSLGVAHENLSNFAKAAEEYRKYLEFGRRNKLPELEQEAQIRQRMIVCERRHQVDADLAKWIPGVWQPQYDNGGERETETKSSGEDEGTSALRDGGPVTESRTTGKHTSVTKTKERFVSHADLELVPDGGVNRKTGEDWTFVKGGYWKVVGKQLIVGGDVGLPSEWCDVGPLVANGQQFEGLTLARHRARYRRTSDLLRNVLGEGRVRATAHDNTVIVTNGAGTVKWKRSFDVQVADFRFSNLKFTTYGDNGPRTLNALYVRGIDCREGFFNVEDGSRLQGTLGPGKPGDVKTNE